MRIPVPLQLAALAVGATAFYTYVGQLVPQKEVHPPQVVEIAKNVSTAQMVEIGKGIFEGKGICTTCHTLGRSGALRFPDLQGVGARAGSRVPGLSDLQYLAQSLYHPDTFIVPGFNPGMPTVNKAPIGLTDDEIKTVIAFLQSLGGTPSITMETDLHGGDVTAAPAAAPAAASASAASAAAAAATPLVTMGCQSCHRLDRPGVQNGAPSLFDAGARLSRAQLWVGVTEHKNRPASLENATLKELQALVDEMTQRKGQG